MRLDLTPWARRDIDPVLKEILRTMEPRKGTVHIGRALRDWRAVATFNGYVIADVRGSSATWAAEMLIKAMDPNRLETEADGSAWDKAAESWVYVPGLDEPEQADGMTQAKARDDLLDGVAHFEWHGHDIEVEVS